MSLIRTEHDSGSGKDSMIHARCGMGSKSGIALAQSAVSDCPDNQLGQCHEDRAEVLRNKYEATSRPKCGFHFISISLVGNVLPLSSRVGFERPVGQIDR